MQNPETDVLEKPKRIPESEIDFPEKRKGLPRIGGIDIGTILLVFVITAVVVLVVLAWLGPAVGNIYGNMIIDI